MAGFRNRQADAFRNRLQVRHVTIALAVMRGRSRAGPRRRIRPEDALLLTCYNIWSDQRRPSANPVEPIKACGSSGEEISPFRRARAFREQLARVPVDRVAEALLVRR